MEKEISEIEYSVYKNFGSEVGFVFLKTCKKSPTSVTLPQQAQVQRGEQESAE